MEQKKKKQEDVLVVRDEKTGEISVVAGLDGKGYPRGLTAEQITLETRIITTADIFDAITAERPYRGAVPVAKTLAIMREEVDKAIDARCLAALERIVDSLGLG